MFANFSSNHFWLTASNEGNEVQLSQTWTTFAGHLGKEWRYKNILKFDIPEHRREELNALTCDGFSLYWLHNADW